MHALKLGDIEAFPFVEPPDGRYVRDGQRTLRELGALTEEGAAHRHRAGGSPNYRSIRASAASCWRAPRSTASRKSRSSPRRLSVPDPRDRPGGQTDPGGPETRAAARRAIGLPVVAQAVARLDGAARAAVAREAARLVQGEFPLLPAPHRMARRARPGDGSGEGRARAEARTRSRREYASIHRALLAGLLSQVAQRKEQGEYLGANGTKLFIHPGSGQFKARPAWIVSAEQVQTTKVYARNVARIDPAWVEQVGAHLVKRQHYEPHWERRASRAAIYERVTLFGLTAVVGPQRALRAASIRRPRASCSSATRWCTWSTTRARRSSRTT